MGLLDLWLSIGIGNHHCGKKIYSLPNLRLSPFPSLKKNEKKGMIVFVFIYFKNIIDKYPKPINPSTLNKSKPNVTQIS